MASEVARSSYLHESSAQGGIENGDGSWGSEYRRNVSAVPNAWTSSNASLALHEGQLMLSQTLPVNCTVIERARQSRQTSVSCWQARVIGRFGVLETVSASSQTTHLSRSSSEEFAELDGEAGMLSFTLDNMTSSSSDAESSSVGIAVLPELGVGLYVLSELDVESFGSVQGKRPLRIKKRSSLVSPRKFMRLCNNPKRSNLGGILCERDGR